MTQNFTIGIEEEFQTVHPQTGALLSCIHPLLEKVRPFFGERVKTELMQPTLELASRVYPDMHVARLELGKQRALLSQLVQEEGVALLCAGTHPSALWQEQKRTEGAHYVEQEQEEQDIGRSLLIFGLHIHIGIEERELAIQVMNQMRMWIPQLLALSANSPFWAGRFTGLRSYRSALWGMCPRSGLPPIMPSWKDFDYYVQALVAEKCIQDGRGIWWDIRPHPFFQTIEIRIFDMPPTLEETLAIAALCQALVAKLTWLSEHGMSVDILPNEYIEENKWRAMRYGLDAQVADFINHRQLSMRDSLHELLDFVNDCVDELGSRLEIDSIRRILDGPDGTGADRQIAIYRQTGDVQEVLRWLIEQTVAGV